jgi:hypothetical protein
MNSSKTAIAILENETITSAAEAHAGQDQAKLFLVPDGKDSGQPMTRRVEAALDFQFARGSMPA